MADRRTFKSRARLEREPPPITSAEFAALRQVKEGWPSSEAIRKRLVSKGLISSSRHRLAVLTPLGRKALDKRLASGAKPQPLPPAVKRIDFRAKWIQKYANCGNPRTGVWS